MRKGTKIALAAGALALVGAAGMSGLAVAEYRGSGGWGHYWGGHHGKGHHGSWHRGRGHHGWGMNRMMERFDTNKDGKLAQDELNEARKKLLAAHDDNKDGKLTLQEFEKLWLEVKKRRMVRSFQRIDGDGDASVTLDEFLKPYAHIVERMDRNDDGVLDREDRRYRGWRHHRDDDDDRPRGPGGMVPRGGG